MRRGSKRGIGMSSGRMVPDALSFNDQDGTWSGTKASTTAAAWTSNFSPAPGVSGRMALWPQA